MKIPYGISSFGMLRRDGYYYVDKTPFLPVLEQLPGRYLLFLRPRRIGKSLLVSLLAHYYDLHLADQFDALFGGLWIHEHPTPERNRYVVMAFDFSSVTTDAGVDALRRTFFAEVRRAVSGVIVAHRERCPELDRLDRNLDRYTEADALLGDLTAAVKQSGHQMYVLIDEYDHFANRLLAAGDQQTYEAIATTTGFVRSFYATLKAGTASGTVARMFVTGVLPLLVDDMSSGFNIATHVSQDADLNTMAGFTHAEVERAVDAFLTARPSLAGEPGLSDRGVLLETLRKYYDGYRFSPRAAERVFNSNMVLYFMSEVTRNAGYPADMLDLNVRTDYGHLRRLMSMAGAGVEERREVLETLVSEGAIESQLIRQFGFQSVSSRESLVSLLYYMGMITLAEQSPYEDQKRLEVPNRVIRELQWEHLMALLREQESLAFEAQDFRLALRKMAVEGQIQPFIDLFHERVVKAIGNKDLRRFDERAIKLMLLAFVSLSTVFYPLSEKEFAQGYCDLFLGVSPFHPAAAYAWLLELKYVPQGATAAKIEQAFSQAEAQIARYASDPRLVPLLTRGKPMKAGALVFVGARKVVFRPWPREAEPRAAAPRKQKRNTVRERTAGRAGRARR